MRNISTFLFFRLEEEIFAVDVKNIIQTTEMTELTPLPETPIFMRGITIFRGNILPVIDLRLKFKLSTTNDQNSGYIVVSKYISKEKNQQIGFVVDKIIDVAEFSEFEITDFPEIGSKYNIEFINGVIQKKEQIAIVLNIDKILSSVEFDILKKSTEKLNLSNKDLDTNEST